MIIYWGTKFGMYSDMICMVYRNTKCLFFEYYVLSVCELQPNLARVTIETVLSKVLAI